MKYIISIILCCLSIGSQAKNSAFSKLAEVNKCWHEQQDVSRNIAAPERQMDDHAWIQYHLELVEQTLRARNVEGLSAEQRARRMASLNDLNAYWHAGRFPINDRYSIRTPIFIDRQDNFCAVGYLLKASGYEATSRKIAATTNLAYVREMKYPELKSWADTHGFTVDELAWIQPAYPPVYTARAVGKGTNGRVNALYADNANGKLYVGGDFTQVDSAISVSYMAYVTEQNGNFTWHPMGSGPGHAGPVNAIVPFEGKIFVCGNVAPGAGSSASYWDGNGWHQAGIISGPMRDMKVMGGTLYAAGFFDGTTAVPLNFASWDGTNWEPIKSLSGTVNTLHAMGDIMVLGGDFNYHGQQLNVIKWSKDGGFMPFANGLSNEVQDFEVFRDTLYAVCKSTDPTDTLSLLMHLEGDRWVGHHNTYFMTSFWPTAAGKSLNTLLQDGNRLFIGGSFHYLPLVGRLAQNNISLGQQLEPTNGEWTSIDSTVNTMVRFKDFIIQGGSFRTGGAGGWSTGRIELNHIAAMHQAPTSVPGKPLSASNAEIVPNPVRNGQLRLKSDGSKGTFRITDINGRTVLSGPVKAQTTQEFRIPHLAPGQYILELEREGSLPVTRPFTIN